MQKYLICLILFLVSFSSFAGTLKLEKRHFLWTERCVFEHVEDYGFGSKDGKFHVVGLPGYSWDYSCTGRISDRERIIDGVDRTWTITFIEDSPEQILIK